MLTGARTLELSSNIGKGARKAESQDSPRRAGQGRSSERQRVSALLEGQTEEERISGWSLLQEAAQMMRGG